MAYSNRTSFVTAEQDSPRNSRKASQEKSNFDSNPYRMKQPVFNDEKTLYDSQTNIESNSHTHSSLHQSSTVASAVSSVLDDVGSSHTVIEESIHTICNQDNGVNTEKDPESSYLPHQTAPELKTYPVAWLLLFFIVCLRAAVSIFCNTFSPIPQVTADFMGISLSNINWLYNIMSICYIVASFFTSYLYNKIGVKWALFLSGVLLSLGCWVRWIAVRINPPSFPVLMVGQTLASFSSPINLNLMTLFSTLWFTENRRATAGMFIVSNYGTIIAMFLMPAIATGKDKIELTVIVVACIATAATVPFLFFPTKPRTPASITAVNDASSLRPQLTLKQGAIMLVKNPHFIILCLIHSLSIGLSIAWGGLMNQAISPYGYSDNEIGNIAAIGVVGGTLGCLISGPVIDRTKQHKVLLKIMAPLMLSTYVAFIFVVQRESFAAILYTNMLNQFFLSFMVPICVELGVEISYPVTESLSTSILWQVAQLVGFILVLIMDLFRDENGVPKKNMYKALIFQAVIAGITFIFAMIFNGPMARSEALEIQKKSAQSQAMAYSSRTNTHYHDSAETLHIASENNDHNKELK